VGSGPNRRKESLGKGTLTQTDAPLAGGFLGHPIDFKHDLCTPKVLIGGALPGLTVFAK
jgi:hypothetical protein